MADEQKKVTGVEAATVMVKNPHPGYGERPVRTVVVARGEELPKELVEGEDERLEKLGVFGPDPREAALRRLGSSTASTVGQVILDSGGRTLTSDELARRQITQNEAFEGDDEEAAQERYSHDPNVPSHTRSSLVDNEGDETRGDESGYGDLNTDDSIEYLNSLDEDERNRLLDSEKRKGVLRAFGRE